MSHSARMMNADGTDSDVPIPLLPELYRVRSDFRREYYDRVPSAWYLGRETYAQLCMECTGMHRYYTNERVNKLFDIPIVQVNEDHHVGLGMPEVTA